MELVIAIIVIPVLLYRLHKRLSADLQKPADIRELNRRADAEAKANQELEASKTRTP